MPLPSFPNRYANPSYSSTGVKRKPALSSTTNRLVNPSYSSTGINRKSTILSATPQQKLMSNHFNTLSCNSKFMAMSEQKQSHQRDSRPLHEAYYHKECIDLIKEFCKKKEFILPNMTNHTSDKEWENRLKSLSKGDMEKLYTFLLSFYEIKMKINEPSSSLENEIPRVMAILGYPYNINRSSIISYTTPKAKGTVLSTLVYLVEPLDEFERLKTESIFSKGEEQNMEILNLVLNRNQEEKDLFIKQRMNQQLKKKNELESLIKKTEELKNESHSLDNQDDQLKKLRESVSNLENQLQEFKRYEDDMKNYVESSSKDNEELKKKIEQTDQEIKVLNDKKLELENKIKEQKHSVDEMNYYIQRDKQVQMEIHKMNEELKKARQEYFQEKLKQDELFDSLKELFFKLTNILRNFKTDLPDAQHLQQCLDNEKYRYLISFIYNPDFDNNDIKFDLELYTEFLKSIKQSLNNDLLICKEEICKCQTELESSLTRIKQLEKKNEMIIEQKQSIIQKIEQKKVDTINQIKNKKQEIEEVKSELNAIDTDVKLKRKKAMNENIELKNKFEETKKEFYEHWASIKSKMVNLEIQLKTIVPLCEEFKKEKERGKVLNAKLNDYINNEKLAIDNLKNDVIIK